MRLFILITTIVVIGYISTSSAFAIEPTPPGCKPLYNGGATCINSPLLHINLKVLNPAAAAQPGQTLKDSDFIENIETSSTHYNINNFVAFRIYITNTSRSALKKILIKDTLPSRLVSLISTEGTFDTKLNTFSTTIDELKPKETKVITIRAVTTGDTASIDNNSRCGISYALATVSNKTSQDTSQLCITSVVSTSSQTSSTAQALPSRSKGGFPVGSPITLRYGQTTPKTGPEGLVLLGLITSVIAGLILRRKTNNYSSSIKL